MKWFPLAFEFGFFNLSERVLYFFQVYDLYHKERFYSLFQNFRNCLFRIFYILKCIDYCKNVFSRSKNNATNTHALVLKNHIMHGRKKTFQRLILSGTSNLISQFLSKVTES